MNYPVLSGGMDEPAALSCRETFVAIVATGSATSPVTRATSAIGNRR